MANIAQRWRELQGSGSWAGLLDPLDSDLRANVIAYGELAQVTYDVFDSDESSAEAGQCMYSDAALLAASGVSHPEYYTVTKHLYATCDFRPWLDQESESGRSVSSALFVKKEEEGEGEGEGSWAYTNWIGYVAVATDEGVVALGRRDIVVAWRGSVKVAEFVKDGDARKVSAAPVVGQSEEFKDAQVHRGFLSVYTAAPRETENNLVQETTDISKIKTSARDQALLEVRRLMELHKKEETSITVTGHSLGASLATLNAVDMVAHFVNKPPGNSSGCPVTAILFASPRVGNKEFKSAFASFPKLRALAVINQDDKVPNLPPIRFGFVDAATATIPIDTKRSPYLRAGTMLRNHNLECYLHGVAGDHGDRSAFELVVDRDVGLVNKCTNALKDGYPVPPKWWDANYQATVPGVVGRCKLENLKNED